MNTPAHAVLNLLVLGRRHRRELFWPIALGAILPDLPMVFFYGYEKGFLGTAERTIWSQSYFDWGWQAFFDVFNSLPLLVLAAALCWRMKWPRASIFFASMVLHSLCDLALHHDDAHRHFFPLSDWRFASPVSYWDPRYHGGIVSVLEVALVMAGSIWLFRVYPRPAPRVLLGLVLGVYAAFIGYALIVWV